MAAKISEQYLKTKARYAELFSAVEALGKACKAAGPIDEKTAQLIQLASSAALHSEGAVHSHTKRALDAGATSDEIHHAIMLLTSTIGFPSVMAAISWVDDVIEKANP